MIQIDSKIFPKFTGAYLVGGSIRDMLCGRTPLDYDVAVVGDPLEFARQVARNTGGRLIEIGKPGQTIIRVVGNENSIDISKAKEASIEDDLRARDFTINAMAFDLSSQRLIDPLKGQQDLKDKTIRMVSKDIYKRDPVRLLRAFRIAAAFQFEFDPQTEAAIETHAALIQQSAGERVREELFKMFHCSKSHPYLCRMADTGLLFAILPELSALKQCRQNRYHQFNAFDHTLRSFSHMEGLLIADPDQALLTIHGDPLVQKINTAQIPLLKLAVLLHDIGKPEVQTTDKDGILHFYDHERQGAPMAEAICKRLKCSKQDEETIGFLVRHHTRPLFLFTALHEQKAHPRAVTRFFIKCAAYIPDLLIVAAADMLGKEADKNKRSAAFMTFLNQLMVDFETDFKPRTSIARLLTGHDLQNEFGLKPSPLYQKILDRVEEERLSRNEMSRQEALALAKSLIAAEGK